MSPDGRTGWTAEAGARGKLRVLMGAQQSSVGPSSVELVVGSVAAGEWRWSVVTTNASQTSRRRMTRQ